MHETIGTTPTPRRWTGVRNLILHFRPLRVPERTIKFAHTFGLGGMSLVLVVLLAASGVLMALVYEPTPMRAYESVVRMLRDVQFGALVRSVHHWSAHFLIGVVLLHLLRVFFSGAFHPPRQLNWLIGLGLLLCVLASNFSGYLLPWDQLSYWAVTITTGMLGYVPLVGEWLRDVTQAGPEIGAATLITFYTAHTTVVPIVSVGLMAWHFWRVRKARGVVVPRTPADPVDERGPEVFLAPNLLIREVAVALMLVAFVMLVAVGFEAPLGDAANAGMSPNPAKAPWYFVGLQELQLHLHPVVGMLIVPLSAVTALVMVPFIRYEADTAGVWFVSPRGRRLARWAAFAAALLTVTWIVLDEYVFDVAAWWPGVPSIVSQGLLPAAILIGIVAFLQALVGRRLEATRSEVVLSAFVFGFVVWLVLTAVGVWFRGSGMALAWPWTS